MTTEPSALPPFACPACRGPLDEASSGNALRCPRDGIHYPRERGVWRLIAPDDASRTTAFVDHYGTVRQDEGWGTGQADYYRSLPYVDTSGRHPEIWKIRAISYQVLLRRVVTASETKGHTLRVLDLGAGNGWLSYRLAERGHAVAAVDLTVDPVDGLGTWPAYVDARAATRRGDPAPPFAPVQASFERLPFLSAASDDGDGFDLAIFNGSLHYAENVEGPLREALRVLRDDGTLVIMDSPFYVRRATGEAMVEERDATFEKRYGEVHASEAFLTQGRIRELGSALGTTWRLVRPWYGWRWALRPLQNRLLGYRPPVRFLVAIGRRRTSG